MGLALKKESVGQQTVVIGLGDTGMSVAQHLSKQGIDFKMLDTRLNPPQLAAFKQTYPDIEVQLGEISTEKFEGAQQIIVSPGVDTNLRVIRQVVEDNQCECVGDIELFARSVTKPVVAITGSNGKSTVTSLLAEMASMAGIKAYAGGNLAPPALSLLDHHDAELYVLELSSFQLESTHSLQPQVSVVLNVSADHLDRHGDVENYAQIKARIYSNAKVSVINRDDDYVANMQTFGKVISFGLDQPENNHFGILNENGDSHLAFGGERLIPVREIALQGEAGILNSLAALAIGHALELPMLEMLKVLKSFKGLPHRLALVAESEGVSWYNDSKGTNIGATVSSLRSLEDNIILIAGGVFKGGDLKSFNQAVSKHAKYVILLGQDAALLQQSLEQSLEHSIAIDCASSMQHAVEIANQKAKSGDKVLLSPACASFDIYTNYIERGKDFEKCVKGVLA